MKAKIIAEMKSKEVNLINERNLEIIPHEIGRKRWGAIHNEIWQ